MHYPFFLSLRDCGYRISDAASDVTSLSKQGRLAKAARQKTSRRRNEARSFMTMRNASIACDAIDEARCKTKGDRNVALLTRTMK